MSAQSSTATPRQSSNTAPPRRIDSTPLAPYRPTSQFLQVAENILLRHRAPLTAKEIVSLGLESGLFSDKLHGRTPHQTLKAKLSMHIRKYGPNSHFVRTAPGRFLLRSLIADPTIVYDAVPLRVPTSTEHVTVFPVRALRNKSRFQGITRAWQYWHNIVLADHTCKAMARSEAEHHNGYKQILAYILVTRRGAVLSYKRGTYSRVEDYLRGSLCVGFGGHLTDTDRNLFGRSDQGLANCAVRELCEELRLPAADRRRLETGTGLEVIGCLNDDSSPVGRRHFAFVMRYEVSDDSTWDRPVRGEKSITQLKWLAPDEGNINPWLYEYWSQLCLREFYGPLFRSGPWFRVLRASRFRSSHVLCVLGQIGSGKTEATDVLVADYGYIEVNSGQVVAELLRMPVVTEESRPEFQRRADAFIAAPTAPHQLATAIWSRATELGSDRIVVDGIRQEATIAELKALVGNRRLAILYVHTPADVAYRFYRSRTGSDAPLADFIRVREAPVEAETASLIKLADAVLYNWTGRRQYRAVIRELMREVRER